MAQPMAYPAAPKRLDSGRYRVSELRRVGANPLKSLPCFHGNSTRRAVGRWPKRWWAGTHPTGPPDSHRHEPQQTGCRSDAVALLDHRSAHTPTKPGVSLKRLLEQPPGDCFRRPPAPPPLPPIRPAWLMTSHLCACRDGRKTQGRQEEDPRSPPDPRLIQRPQWIARSLQVGAHPVAPPAVHRAARTA